MYTCLPENVVEKIREEVNKIKVKYGIVNKIIRNDIFEILDKLCVVLRYPLDDEEANGIHVERYIKGQKKDFVFINTSNGIEKQIYTAAHELGHVWRIDEKVLEKVPGEYEPEAIINRFVAELLIPSDIFIRLFAIKCEELHISEGPVEEKQIISVVVALMNMFVVPYKAVVFRLHEIGILDSNNCNKLEKCEKKYESFIQECVIANEYQNILKTDKQKSMSDLYTMLNIAEKNELLSDNKINAIKELFGYNTNAFDYDDAEEIAIRTIPKE